MFQDPGDGVNDLAVGAPGSTQVNASADVAWILDGRDDDHPLPREPDLAATLRGAWSPEDGLVALYSSATGGLLRLIEPPGEHQHFGTSVAPGVDVTGDRVADPVVCATGIVHGQPGHGETGKPLHHFDRPTVLAMPTR